DTILAKCIGAPVQGVDGRGNVGRTCVPQLYDIKLHRVGSRLDVRHGLHLTDAVECAFLRELETVDSEHSSDQFRNGRERHGRRGFEADTVLRQGAEYDGAIQMARECLDRCTEIHVNKPHGDTVVPDRGLLLRCDGRRAQQQQQRYSSSRPHRAPLAVVKTQVVSNAVMTTLSRVTLWITTPSTGSSSRRSMVRSCPGNPSI